MPKKEINYQNTIIYKIVCNDLNVVDVYVGHTTDFTNRKRLHKTKCSIENDKMYNVKVYQMIRAKGGWDNWTMIEIEKYPCNDKNEACARERHFYELLNANLNSRCPITNELEKKDQNREYRENNKEKIKTLSKVYHEKNKDKIKEYAIARKNITSEYIKHYYELHKDELAVYNKMYRDVNKEKIQAHRKQIFVCECGKKCIHDSKARHFKSIKHIKYMEEKNKDELLIPLDV